jgi:hypothetical protein
MNFRAIGVDPQGLFQKALEPNAQQAPNPKLQGASWDQEGAFYGQERVGEPSMIFVYKFAMNEGLFNRERLES